VGNRAPASYFRTDFLPTPEDLSLDELKKILEEKKYSKIEDLLALLAQDKPKYMSHYALGYHSGSIQQGSKSNPRALVYGRTGNFIIAFNGDKKQNGYEFLEVMNFDQDKREFQFFEIEFNEKLQLGTTPYKISENGGPNKKCLVCHVGSRPIWNAYDIWPGFYGSGDDYPITASPKGGAGSVFRVERGVDVVAEWTALQNGPLKAGRYQHLQPPGLSVFSSEDNPRPNTDLGTVLFMHNMKRIERLLEQGDAHKMRHGLLYAHFCVPAMDPESPLFKNAQEFAKRSDEKLILHQVRTALSHARELGISWRTLMEKAVKDNPGGDFEAKSEYEFFSKFVRNRGLTELVTKTQMPVLLSFVEKYLPKSEVQTWALNKRLGAFNFSYGGEFADFFDRAVVSTAIGESPSAEDQALLETLRKARREYNSDYTFKMRAGTAQGRVHPLAQPCQTLYEQSVLPTL
jgi:hypothetical protein